MGAQRIVPRPLGAAGAIDATGDDLVLVGKPVRGGADAALGTPDALDKLVRLPTGQMKAGDGLAVPMSDLLVHTWDLARATGANDRSRTESGQKALADLEAIADLLRSPGFHGPKVEPAAGTDVQNRLQAFLGRTVQGQAGEAVLDPGTATLSAQAPSASASDPGNGASITDTEAAGTSWLASASTTGLTRGTNTINGQNPALTDVTPVAIAGHALTASDVTTQSVASTGTYAAGATGTDGLQGYSDVTPGTAAEAHQFAATISTSPGSGDGSVHIDGLLTLTGRPRPRAGLTPQR